VHDTDGQTDVLAVSHSVDRLVADRDRTDSDPFEAEVSEGRP
jgi:hypothetical protein